MASRSDDLFAILRPTSPFRTAATIRRALDRLVELGDRADSIRAVELCRQHPGKMWLVEGDLMRPLLPQPEDGTPWHSSQYKALPPVYVQNSSLEIAWSRVLEGEGGTIAGDRIAAFLTEGHEGFSIDYPDDFTQAEELAHSGTTDLPAVMEAAA
jgi:N-acylneuraminate cytidylyltransferase